MEIGELPDIGKAPANAAGVTVAEAFGGVLRGNSCETEQDAATVTCNQPSILYAVLLFQLRFPVPL